MLACPYIQFEFIRALLEGIYLQISMLYRLQENVQSISMLSSKRVEDWSLALIIFFRHSLPFETTITFLESVETRLMKF